MNLYFHPASPYCQKVLVALYEKGADFTAIHVNLADVDARAAYCKSINPLGKLPMLIRDDGWVVPESSIILEYLDVHCPAEPNLIPADRDQARQSRFYDRLGDNYLIEAANELCNVHGDDARAAVVAQAKIALSLFEKELNNRRFLLAERFTQADIAPAIGMRHLARRGVDLAPYARISAYVERIWARPAWQKVAVEAWG